MAAMTSEERKGCMEKHCAYRKRRCKDLIDKQMHCMKKPALCEELITEKNSHIKRKGRSYRTIQYRSKESYHPLARRESRRVLRDSRSARRDSRSVRRNFCCAQSPKNCKYCS